MAERRALLWGAAVVTLVGVVVAARVEDEPEAPSRSARRGAAADERPVRAGSPAAAVTAGNEDALRPIAFARMNRPLFDTAEAARIALAWEPPPPPPPSRPQSTAPAKPPPPQAPPLPFKAIGRFEDGINAAAIVQVGQITYVLRRGDVVERNYRVDEVNDKEVTLMYLPLSIVQILPLEGAR